MKTKLRCVIALVLMAVLATTPGCLTTTPSDGPASQGSSSSLLEGALRAGANYVPGASKHQWIAPAITATVLAFKLASDYQKQTAQERAAAYKKQREANPPQTPTTSGTSQPTPPPKVIAVEVPPGNTPSPPTAPASGQPVSVMLVDYESGMPIDNNVYEVASRPTNDQRIELKKAGGEKTDAVFVSPAGLP